jgi:uncharacterized membrane protein YhhN
MDTPLLVVLAAVSAFLHIRAEYGGARHQVYIFKPLTITFIILIVILAGTPDPSRYRLAIVAGLICSLAGDIFLMLPSDRFVAGLLSFLGAHLFYVAAFTSEIGFRFSLWSSIPAAILGVFMLAFLLPYLGKMKLPVLVYMVVILVMACQAWERWTYTGQRVAMLAFFGAVFFLVSDSALAINRFRGQYKSAPALILGTYFAAQCLIALSTG